MSFNGFSPEATKRCPDVTNPQDTRQSLESGKAAQWRRRATTDEDEHYVYAVAL